MVKAITLLLVAGGLAACGMGEKVVQAVPEAAKVTVVRDVDKPFKCKSLGDIRGLSKSENEAKAKEGALNDFKNQAAGMKANYALVEAENSGPIGTTSIRQYLYRGKALQCEDSGAGETPAEGTPPAQPAP